MEDDFVPDIEPPEYATLREKLKEGKKIYCVDEATATKIKVDIPDLCCCYDFNNDYDVYIINQDTIIRDVSVIKSDTFICVI
jgi:hypothetical protein